MHRWVVRASVCLAGVALLSGQGCPATPDGGDNGDGPTVRIRLKAFDPQHITIDVGQTVLWRNDDLIPHTVTSGNPEDEDAGSIFDSGLMFFGQTFEHTFTEPGTFVYFCVPHADTMRDATVTVRPVESNESPG